MGELTIVSMKKFLLSAFVIFSFIVYSIHERKDGNEQAVIAPPKSSDAPSANSSISQNPSPVPSPPTLSQKPGNTYTDGQYTGENTDAYYGFVQVTVTIQNGALADVVFLNYPQDRRTSISINTQAMPYLKSEAIQAQDSNVDIVTGATQTSLAFRQSLKSALAKAKRVS